MNVGARLPFRIASFLLAIVFLLGSALGVIDIWRGGKLEFGSKLNTTAMAALACWDPRDS
jgi:hypothetical protein